MSIIHNILGMNESNGLVLYSAENTKIQLLPSRLQQSLKIIDPLACFFMNQVPIILFFEVKNFDQFREIHKKVWNFNTSPLFMIFSPNEIRIHNAFIFDKDQNKSYIESLLGDIKNNQSNTKKLDQFNYKNIISNKYWNDNKKYFYNSSQKVDVVLLKNIYETRKILVSEGLNEELTNSLIGRLLFIRYLIDRNVDLNYPLIRKDTAKNDLLEILSSKDQLYNLFHYLKLKFNGDMFPINDREASKIETIHLNILQHLFSGSDLNYNKKIIQQSLFDMYDFSIIPIELISNIYETFIGKKASDNTKDNLFASSQKDNKSFYTPPYLVDYMLLKTLNPILEKQNYCRILDPSCGSGIFLVESLRRIIAKNNNLLIQNGAIDKLALKQLVIDNIFGIDIDAKALDIAKFSIYITMLDYMNPKEIENFRFPSLRDNFFNEDFFKLSDNTKEIINKCNLDLLIGNPPWGNTSDVGDAYIKYAKDHSITLNRKQIAQAFMLRVDDFLTPTTKVALIVTSKILYNVSPSASNFRQKFLESFNLEEVFDFSASRKDLFLMADNPAAILFYSKRSNHKYNNLVELIAPKPNILFKLLKLIVVEKNDVKQVLQKKFMPKYGGDDWLWKTILYGNAYDTLFIKRLKNEFTYSINNHPSLKKSKVGFQVSGGDKMSTEEIANYKFINVNKAYGNVLLKNFYVDCENAKPFQDVIQKKFIHRTRDINIYQGPHVLIRKGTASDIKLEAAFCPDNVVFTDAITSIRAKKQSDTLILKNLVGLFNSELFKYYFLNISSSVGVEREQGFNDLERFTFPLPNHFSVNLAEIVDKITECTKQNLIGENNHNLRSYLIELNNEIYKLYQVSPSEKILIDYMNDVTLPMIQGESNYLRVPSNDEIKDYIFTIFASFDLILSRSNKSLSASVYKNSWNICIHFALTSSGSNTIEFFNSINDFDVILKKLNVLSLIQYTNEILFQKDIKGFEKNAFFILKPAELKHWHKATARLDSDNLIEAILSDESENNDR